MSFALRAGFPLVGPGFPWWDPWGPAPPSNWRIKSLLSDLSGFCCGRRTLDFSARATPPRNRIDRHPGPTAWGRRSVHFAWGGRIQILCLSLDMGNLELQNN